MDTSPLFIPSTPRVRRKHRARSSDTPQPPAALQVTGIEDLSFGGEVLNFVVVFDTSAGNPLEAPIAADPAKWTARYGGEQIEHREQVEHRKVAARTPQVAKAARVQFGPPPTDSACDAVVRPTLGKPRRAKREKVKNDPKHVAAARELRDRYLEQVNSGRLIAQAPAKYAVGRALAAGADPAARQDGGRDATLDRTRALPMLPVDAAAA